MAGSGKGFIVSAVLVLVAALLSGVPTAVAAEASPEFVGMRPVRVADTRHGTGGVPVGKVLAGQTLTVSIAGQYGVPAEVKAVSLNVTLTEPQSHGWVTVWPCGEERPLASNLNFVTGQTVPNAVVVKTGTAGAVCLYTSATTHLLADLNGHFPSTADYTGVVPARAADTRVGTGVAQAKVLAGQTLVVPVVGQHGIGAEASSVAANVTVTEPESYGWVTVWPCGQERPLASNLNFVWGQTVPNAVIAGIGSNGSVCLYTTATTHLIMDVNGFFTDASDYEPLVPQRLFDTRTEFDGKLLGGVILRYQVAEPGELLAVVLNVTVTEPYSHGWVTVYPCSNDVLDGPPVASNLNYLAGQTVPNMVIAPVSDVGNVCFFNASTAAAHIFADINGVVYPPDTPVP